MNKLPNTLLRSVTPFAAIATVAFAIQACSTSTDAAARSASDISFTVGSPATMDASAAAAPITNGGHTLDLTGVKLTISQASLKRVETDACEDHDDEDDEHTSTTSGTTGASTGTSTGTTTTTTDPCAPLKIGSTTIDLPLDGKLITLPGNVLSAGTFRQLDLKISQVELIGTFDSKAFDVTIPVKAHDEIDFNPPLVVSGSTPTSVTVNVPVSTWLVNADGSLVDPSQLATNQSLMEQVKHRIARSLRAFEDRDHTGHDENEHDHG